MRSAFPAAFAYFLGAFAAGFILGTIRTLALEPALGRTLAVSVEAPIILTISWFLCAWCVKRFKMSAGWPARVTMGVLALALLLGAETVLGFALGRSLGEQIAAYQNTDALLGLAAQCIFAAFPLIQARSATS